MKKSIKIQVVSDVACPWCYIGKRRLENAVKQFNDEIDFEIEYAPFQLDPHIPIEGKDWTTYFESKFGNVDRIDAIFQRVESVGKGVNIHFDFKAIPKIPNTMPLHIILEQARVENIQAQVADTLFQAYMVEPQDLTNLSVIQKLMEHFGWTAEKTGALIADPERKKNVQKEIEQAQKLGITGVPFFIVNGKYGISGAQTEEVFINAFKSINAEISEEDGAACEIESGLC